MSTKEKNKPTETEKYLKGKTAIVWIVIGVAVAIVLCLIAFTVVLCRSIDTMPAGSLVKLELLDAGLAIIGLAVAIWGGLNIANALDRQAQRRIHVSRLR